MGKIATWSDVNSKFGISGSPINKCPTKSELVAKGVVVSGNYASNQTVQIQDLSMPDWYLNIQIRTVITGSPGNWDLEVQWKVTGGNLTNYPNTDEFDILFDYEYEYNSAGDIKHLVGESLGAYSAEGYMNMIGDDWQSSYFGNVQSTYGGSPMESIMNVRTSSISPSIVINA